jgi:hypothetical protein
MFDAKAPLFADSALPHLLTHFLVIFKPALKCDRRAKSGEA